MGLEYVSRPAAVFSSLVPNANLGSHTASANPNGLWISVRSLSIFWILPWQTRSPVPVPNLERLGLGVGAGTGSSNKVMVRCQHRGQFC